MRIAGEYATHGLLKFQFEVIDIVVESAADLGRAFVKDGLHGLVFA